MPSEILERYARGPEGEVVVEVAASRLEDLYNDFDRLAPYVRRDLDPELGEYLLDCARELGKHPFVIRFVFETPPRPELEDRLRQSVPNYFRYLMDLQRRRTGRTVRRALLFLGAGLGLVTLAAWAAVLIKTTPGAEKSVLSKVVAEGLTIAAWVAIWESLAVILIEWFPRRRERRVLQRLADAPLIVEGRGATPPAPELASVGDPVGS